VFPLENSIKKSSRLAFF